MSRAFWFAAGAASGVYALVRAKRALEVFTPDGLGARVVALRAGGKVFADEVRAGMSEREEELREQLAVPSPRSHHLIESGRTEQAPREGGHDGHR